MLCSRAGSEPKRPVPMREKAAGTMELKPLKNAPFGMEVLGLDPVLARASQVEALKKALWEQGLLLFRGRVLTKGEQVAFSRNFGDLEVFPSNRFVSEEQPEVYPVSNRADRGYTEVGQYWHADGSFRQKPTELSFFHMVEAATEGGDTAYADMQAAIDHLPAATRAIMDELFTIHGNGRVHPLLRGHPITDQQALYVNFGMMVGLTRPKSPPIGVTPATSRRILEEIEIILDNPVLHYRHQWRAGDLVVADNRRIAHKAFPAPAHTTRLLHRTTTKGN